jgi:hypothetical protein
MKSILFTLVLVILNFKMKAQNKYCGVWRDYEANEMTIKGDSSFHFRFQFDLIDSWANGIYKVRKDTLYFTWIPIYDTLRLYDSAKNKFIDSLIISQGQTPKLLTEVPLNNFGNEGQSKHFLPKKLYYQKDILYSFHVNTGKMLTKNFKPLWGSKKVPAGYHRINKPST